MVNFAPALLTVAAAFVLPPLCRKVRGERKEEEEKRSRDAFGASASAEGQPRGDSGIYGDQQAQAEAAASAASVIQLTAVTRKNSEKYSQLD